MLSVKTNWLIWAPGKMGLKSILRLQGILPFAVHVVDPSELKPPPGSNSSMTIGVEAPFPMVTVLGALEVPSL